MQSNKKGEVRVRFIALKAEIERELEKGHTCRTLHARYNEQLSTEYSNFVKLVHRVIYNKPDSRNIKKNTVPETSALADNIGADERPTLGKPFKLRKIDFSATPNPEQVARWIGKKTQT